MHLKSDVSSSMVQMEQKTLRDWYMPLAKMTCYPTFANPRVLVQLALQLQNVLKMYDRSKIPELKIIKLLYNADYFIWTRWKDFGYFSCVIEFKIII